MKNKILVVDDESAIRELLLLALVQNGYEVTTAKHGQYALLVIDKGEFIPDIVLTDVGMPVLDGVGLAHQLRTRNIGTEIIFMSGGDLGSHTESELKEYSPYLLFKPFSLKILEGLIERLLTAGVNDKQPPV